MVVGGGVDIVVNKHIGMPLVDADFDLPRLGNNFTHANNSQSNFRFQVCSSGFIDAVAAVPDHAPAGSQDSGSHAPPGVLLRGESNENGSARSGPSKGKTRKWTE
jgi:hypothetical protein